MTLPRKPDPGRRPTTRAGKPSTARGERPEPPPPPKKNNLPIILGAAGGGVLLLILIIVAASGGGSKAKPVVEERPKAAKVDVPKKIVPDVSALEATGKQKCDEGLRLVESRLAPDPSAPAERVRADLESGLKMLREGLDAYQQAIDKAGKTYALDAFKKAQSRGIKVLCTQLEKEGQAACDQGLKLIQSNEARMTETGKLGDDEKKTLKSELQKGVDLIRDGMNLFDRSQQVSGHTFETTQYTKARKAAAMKIGELK